MAEDEFSESFNEWPVPKFYFQVEWGKHIMTFEEISGLDVESDVIEYRHGSEKTFSTIKMPGMVKSSNITMKKGIFVDDNAFSVFFNQVKANLAGVEKVIIKLLDESGAPTMVWTLENATPINLAVVEAEFDGDINAIESLVISHEGLTISNS